MSKSKRDKKRSKKSRRSGSPVETALKAVPKKRRPKKKCCLSKPRCRRCPLEMLKHGELPPGLTVQHRRVVTADRS